MTNLLIRLVLVGSVGASLASQGDPRHEAELSRGRGSPPGAAPGDFVSEVVRLSAEADVVDRLWSNYKHSCGVRVGARYDFGREWFALWDRAARATVASPVCAEMQWRVLEAGDATRSNLLRARALARRALLPPATEVGVLRWHGLEWH